MRLGPQRKALIFSLDISPPFCKVMENQSAVNSGASLTAAPADVDEEMDDDDGRSQYHSANESETSPHPDRRSQYTADEEETLTQQYILPSRQHTPLFLPSPSDDVGLQAQWETDSAQSASNKPDSDGMSTPRAKTCSLPEETIQ